MNLNKVFMAGNLTRDPELSFLPSQTALCSIGIAVNREWKSKDGEKKSEVCFIDCIAFGKTAENINKYFAKGNPIFLEGRLQFDQWTAQDGTKRSKHKLAIDRFQFLGQNKEAEQKPPADNNGGGRF